jgi:hypothetical protein
VDLYRHLTCDVIEPSASNAVPSHTWVRRVSGWWLGYCVVVGVVRRNQLLRVEALVEHRENVKHRAWGSRIRRSAFG